MKNYLTTGILFIVFIVYTAAVKFVDVQPIGPLGSSVGFAKLNGAAAELFPYNATWYSITKYLGYAAILICLFFGGIGFLELVQRKSLRRVDTRILIQGGFYIVVICFYVLFEKLIINYRPVLEEGALEASYPSSHTVLAVCVFLSTVLYYGIGLPLTDSRWNGIRHGQIRILAAVMIVLTLVMVFGRLFSGVHWLTDIVGGVLLSAALLSGYIAVMRVWG